VPGHPSILCPLVVLILLSLVITHLGRLQQLFVLLAELAQRADRAGQSRAGSGRAGPGMDWGDGEGRARPGRDGLGPSRTRKAASLKCEIYANQTTINLSVTEECAE